MLMIEDILFDLSYSLKYVGKEKKNLNQQTLKNNLSKT